jgi:CSLREA domain-containing protein
MQSRRSLRRSRRRPAVRSQNLSAKSAPLFAPSFWLGASKAKSRRARQSQAVAIAGELLEVRTLLSTFFVNSTDDTFDVNLGNGFAVDSNGNTSLRAAIQEANSLPGPDIIVVPSGTFSISRTGINEDAAIFGDLDITSEITIRGAGSALTIFDGADLDRVLDVTTVGKLNLSGVTIQNGTAGNAGGIKNSGVLNIVDSVIQNNVVTGATNSVGGGIGNSLGTLTLDGVTVQGNTATINGGGLYNNSGSVTIIDSTFENNSAAGDGGGLSIFRGSLTFTGGTIRNNTAGVDGGGLSVDAATVKVIDTTINNNTATEDGGGVNSINAANVLVETSTITANVAGSFGAGIRNFNATFGLTSSTVSANSSGQSGGGFENDRGVAEIAGTLFQGNTAGDSGGGLNTFSASTAITNSTFSGNQSIFDGGGINNGNLSVATIVNSTIVANTAGSSGRGGGARNFGSMNVANTIFSNNVGVASGRELFGSYTSLGNNLIREIGGAAGFFNGTNGDLIGNSSNVFEPFITPLQDNGGPTLSHALLIDSPAIDAGNSNGAGQIDQTGATRIQDGNVDNAFAVDIGAVEYVAPLTTFIVNTTNDTIDVNIGNGTVEDSDGNVSLRAAILEANALPGQQIIQVPAGTIQLTLEGFDDTGFAGDLDILDDLIIESIGGAVIVDAGGLDRVFQVNSSTVSIDGVSMQNGSTTFAGGFYGFNSNVTLSNLTVNSNTATGAVNSNGGGLLQEQGILTLDNVTVSDNASDLDGAGIYVITATLNVANSTISGNAAALNGGGIAIVASTSAIDSTTVSANTSVLDGAGIAIASNSNVSITGSTIDSNVSQRYGGGLHANSSFLSVTETTVKNNSTTISGAGINNELGTLTVLNSSIYKNSATVDGGGLDNFQGIVSVTGSTISGNSAGQNGAGIVNFASGTVKLVNSTITQNDATVFGGGAWNAGAMQLGNTIIAQNTGFSGAPDVSGTLTSLGTNLIGNNLDTSGIVNVVGGDIVGTSFVPIDPMLSPLGDYGGSTWSHLPLVGSPVIESGTDVVNGQTTDQRGKDRVSDSNFNGFSLTDIGAVEFTGLTYSTPASGLALSFGRVGDVIQITDNSIGAVILAADHTEFDQFQLLGSNFSDTVTIDLSGGYALPVGGIDIVGAGNSDADVLMLTAGSVGTSAHVLTGEVDGSIAIDGRAVTYTSIETKRDWSIADTKSFEFTDTTSNVLVSDSGTTTDGLLQVTRSGGATVEFAGPTNSLGITTQAGSDVISVASVDVGSAFGVSILANDGNDTIDVSLITGDSSIDAGPGADTVQAGSGNDFISGSLGNDQLFGNDGNDIMLGGAGPDMLQGGNGNDSVNGQGSSKDSLTGGLGDDLIIGGGGIDILFETADVDFTLSASGMTGLGSDTLIQVERAVLNGGDSDNRITVEESFIGDVTLDGGFGNDTLIAGSGNDVVIDSGGNDDIDGGTGNDTLLGGSGRDSIAGGFGNDFLFGLGGSGDRLTGGPGLDYIHGGAGADKLFESTTAYSSVVATDLTLTLTDSSLTGLGDDILIGIESATLLGGAGNDILDASGFSGFVYLLGVDGNDQLLGGSAGDLIDGGNGDDVLQGNGGNDSLYGFAGDDTLKGSFGDDLLDGGDGDDGITGSFGDDLIYGQMGRDTLLGDDGNDILVGGGGSDTLIGGSGADQVNGNGGVDVLAGGIGGFVVGDPGDFILGAPEEIDELFRFFADWTV